MAGQDFDDGFVAYINGVEIARSNIVYRPNFNDGTITDREATMWQSGSPVRYPINDIQTLLNDGDNVLRFRYIIIIPIHLFLYDLDSIFICFLSGLI